MDFHGIKVHNKSRKHWSNQCRMLVSREFLRAHDVSYLESCEENLRHRRS